MNKLAACLLNVSEANNRKIVEQIAKAGIVNVYGKENQNEYLEVYLKQKHTQAVESPLTDYKILNEDVLQKVRIELFGQDLKSQSTVLNIFMDPIYNRSVITIAGTLPGVEKGVTDACTEAFRSLKGIIYYLLRPYIFV